MGQVVLFKAPNFKKHELIALSIVSCPVWLWSSSSSLQTPIFKWIILVDFDDDDDDDDYDHFVRKPQCESSFLSNPSIIITAKTWWRMVIVIFMVLCKCDLFIEVNDNNQLHGRCHDFLSLLLMMTLILTNQRTKKFGGRWRGGLPVILMVPLRIKFERLSWSWKGNL